jgi:hypothetical protein
MKLDVSLKSQDKKNVKFHEYNGGVYEGSLYVTYHADLNGIECVEFLILDGGESFDIYEKEHIIAVRDVLTNIINDMEAS